jgi:carbonic anhydrase
MMYAVINKQERNQLSKILEEVLAANAAYAETFGDKSKLGLIPARRFAILTCMDARLDPARYAGLSEGDAHVIRNAGARANDDAIMALVISHKLLGTCEWFVIHHTNCGMALFTEEAIRELLNGSPDAAMIAATKQPDTGAGDGSTAGDLRNQVTFEDSSANVLIDVKRLREHPLVPRNLPIYGYVYDVHSGRLLEVAEATEVGKAATNP